jgi:hypothetical protein
MRGWALLLSLAACGGGDHAPFVPNPLPDPVLEAGRPDLGPGPFDLVATGGGAFLVRGIPAEAGSMLSATHLDAEGRTDDEPRELARVAGLAAQVRAVPLGDGLAVAWCSVVGDETERYGVIFTDRSGRPTAAVEDVGPDRADLPGPRTPDPSVFIPARGCNIELVRLDRHVVVVSRHGRWLCHGPDGEWGVPCGLVSAHHVFPDGTVGTMTNRMVTTMPITAPATPVRGRTFVTFTYGVHFPRAGEARCLMHGMASCLTGLDARLLYTGDEDDALVGLGRLLTEDDGLHAWAIGGTREPHPLFPHGGYAAVSSRTLRCHAASIRMEIALATGDRLVIDPSAPGASGRLADLLQPASDDEPEVLAAVWTGRALVLARRELDGRATLAARSCEDGAISWR